MFHAHKPLDRQTVVITGATSGIGLATARRMSNAGATVFLIARGEEALGQLTEELRANGRQADYAVADVSDRQALKAAAARAIEVFGGFDAWVNNAAVFMYGSFLEVPPEDQRRLFDVIYWGTVNGTLIAADHLAQRGGTIVNVGSVLGELAIPFEGTYCAAKFAVKGFTEAFRREVGHARLPISLTLIKPGAINTPIVEHARNWLGTTGTRNPPPTYDASLVARAIAHACSHPVRDLTVGGAGGAALVVANRVAPRLMDLLTARAGLAVLSSHDPGRRERRDNLDQPRENLSEASSLDVATRRSSLLLEAQLHPVATTLGGLAALAGLGLLAGIGAVTAASAAPRRAPPRARRSSSSPRRLATPR